MDLYFTFKLICEVVVCVLFLMIILAVCFSVAIECFRENRIRTYMESIDFERYVSDVSSFGGKVFYGYRRNSTGECIDERELFRMTFKDVKKRFYKVGDLNDN